MSFNLDASYWDQRYRENRLGWDIGYPSTPLKEYVDQLENKSLRILLPGGGNAYEAEYLYSRGFQNVSVVDISEVAKVGFFERVPEFPKHQFVVKDFFDLKGEFDIILEQTFFCALDPSLRSAYAQKVLELLKPGGKLIGVLFDFPLQSGPPFGGSKSEYLTYFETDFTIQVFERCYNSISPRSGKEFFINLSKKLGYYGFV